GDNPHCSPRHRPPEHTTVEALERNTPHDGPEHTERLQHVKDVPPPGETCHNGAQQVVDTVEVHDVEPAEAAHAELNNAGVERVRPVPEGRRQADHLDPAVRVYLHPAAPCSEHGYTMPPPNQVARDGLDRLSLAAGFGARRVNLRDVENPQRHHVWPPTCATNSPRRWRDRSKENSSMARRCPASPMRRASSGSQRSLTMARATSSGAWGSTSRPVSPSRTTSGIAPPFPATTGNPAAAASR